jgi:pimeloyl-ACP methyl ester carboxylesterase
MHFTAARLLILAAVLLASGGLLWIGLTLLIAWSILTPPRMSAGKAIYHLRRLSPGDLGLGFEEQSFTVRDLHTGRKMRLASWWIPASPSSNRCAILIHGYADAKVGSIAFAPLLNDLDLNILAVDLRAHGESDGRFSTGGFFERDDISQVIDQIRSDRPFQTERIILFGISLGASVACGVAAARSDIAGVILESPFPSYQRVITNHARLMHLPGGWMLKSAISLAQKFGGADFSRVRVVDLMKLIRCPALLIVGSEDELLYPEDIAALQAETRADAGSELWLVERAGHLQAMSIDPIEYRQRVEKFVQQAITQC